MQMNHVGVVGAGSFGRHHVRHLSRHPLVRRVTVIDADRARAEEIAEANNASAATSLDGLDLDAAVVTVPTEAHRSVAETLIGRGTHVFIEKPVAGTDADAAALVAAAKAAGLVLQVGHIERFSGAFQTLADVAGSYNRIVARRHNLPRPVPPKADVVLDLMIHDIDLALTLAASPVKDVEASAPEGTAGEVAEAVITFQNGIVAELSASRLAQETERSLTTYDTDGAWIADLAAGRLTRRDAAGETEHPLPTPHDNLGVEMDEFVRAALGEMAPRVDGAAGLAALTVANRIRASLATSSLPLTA